MKHAKIHRCSLFSSPFRISIVYSITKYIHVKVICEKNPAKAG